MGLSLLLLLLKITCVLLVALGATLAMQRASAGSRHLIWLLSLGALLILPPLALWAPLELPVLPEAPVASAPPSTEQKLQTPLVAPPAQPAPSVHSQAAST